MPLTFYPHPDDAQKGSLQDRVDVMMEAAERYKAFVLDEAAKPAATPDESNGNGNGKRLRPIDLTAVYNWEEISLLLREVREMSEASDVEKRKKADLLRKLAEVYEVLREAKMPKLEAVRVSLISEANQLSGGSATP